MTIEGIPDGWELVGVRSAEHMEAFIDNDGSIAYWAGKKKSVRVFPIIRKIEKPKQYRPFANAAEFEPYWGKPVRSKSEAAVDSLSAVVFAGRLTVDVVFPDSIRTMKYAEAFDILIFANGTPFGIEVTE